MDSTMKAGLLGGSATIFCALSLDYSAFDLNLIDGGFVTFDSKAFVSEDATYGVLDSLDEVEDGAGEQAPRVRISLLPPSTAAMQALTDPAEQMRAQATAWLGLVDEATGQVIGTPEVLFVGYVDTSDFAIRAGSWAVTLDCASELDRALDSREGWKLNPGFHESIWPGEKGLAFVTGVDDPVYWGLRPPGRSIIPGFGGTGTSGGTPTTWGGSGWTPDVMSV